jgi:F-type H+-transporting ATPase subunit epsilon
VAKAIPFTLITPTAVAYEGEAELVIVVGTEGEEGILASHAPFLTALRPGILRANVIENGAPKRLELATSEGFMQALPERVTVLVDEALARERIDVAAAKAELGAAEESLKKLLPQSAEYARLRAVADFASAKLSLAG